MSFDDAYASDREESRGARNHPSTGTCPQGRHRMHSDGRGGGVCACGETVDRSEL